MDRDATRSVQLVFDDDETPDLSQRQTDINTNEYPGGYWEWHLPTNQFHCSSQWCDVVGIDPSNRNGTPTDWLERVHPADYDALMKAIRPLVLGDSDTFERKHRLRHADGHWIVVRARATLIRNSYRDPFTILGVLSLLPPAPETISVDELA